MRIFLFLATFSALATAVPQTLKIGNGGEPKDLDAHIVTGTPEFAIIGNLFEGLVEKDPKTLKVIPNLASKWEVSEDGKTYTFHLRKNLVWSDGSPLTAKDFVYSWIRILDPKTASEFANYAYFLVNGEAFNKGTIKDPSQVGVMAVDDNTLKVTLVNPTPYFLGLVAHACMSPVPQKAIEKFGAKWTRPENMVSNGPYVLVSWQTNQEIKVKKNPKYWNAKKVKLDEASFMVVENSDTEEKMFRTGQIDITYEIPPEKLENWQKDKSGALQTFDYYGTYFYRFNTKKPGLTDKRVRRALSLAINRNDLVKYVTKANQGPALTFSPPIPGEYVPTPRLPSDLSRLAEAKKLLAEAGFPEGKGLPTFEVLYNSNALHKKLAEAIQQMWKTNLGLNVTIHNEEWKVALATIKSGNYQISRAGWIGNYIDPNTFLELYLTQSALNQTGWSNAQYDELMAKATKEKDAKARFGFMKQAEDILLDEMPIMPIYYYKRNCLKQKKVKGWFHNLEDLHPLKYMSVG